LKYGWRDIERRNGSKMQWLSHWDSDALSAYQSAASSSPGNLG
jgi:hypothetical protein